MKVAVFGAGGVGGYFGGRMAQAGADVHLIARGEHLSALREGGLTVDSVFGDFAIDLPATDDPADIGPCDFVLFTVKATDTESAARDLHPLIGDETAVITLQNGVRNEALLADEVGTEHVMGGVAYIFSTIAEPGVIEHTGGPTRFVYGELDGRRSARAERLLEFCRDADIDAELSEDIHTDLWTKFLFICAQSGMTAATRLPLGAIRETESTWRMYGRIMDEVAAVGRADGVDIDDETVEEWRDLASGLEPELTSSLHYDLTHEKPMELEALHGDVVDRAETYGVDVPMTEAVYALLKPWADRFARE